MKLFTTTITSLFAVFIGVAVLAQDSPFVMKGDKMVDKFQYEEALYFYLTAFEAEGENPAITRRIASAYRKLQDLEKSASWYELTLSLDTQNPEDMLFFAEALKSLERYDDAVFWYAKYLSIDPNDSRAQSHANDPKYFMDLQADSIKYRIQKLAINSDKPAFGVCKMDDQFLFSSSGINEDYHIGSQGFEINPFLDIYVCEKDLNNEFILATKIDGEVNSKFHDGPVYYDSTSETMFITRNNMKNGKPVRDANGNVNLKIFSSTRTADGWSTVEELPFNSLDYSTGHPCLSADGQTLYFVSNMEGGKGGTDIYKSKKTANGWAAPQNLGSEINTEGDEMFPFLAESGALYFSSNGHAGLGGLDLFESQPKGTQWSAPVNLGYPINTNNDDFSILYDTGDDSGYFTSNRQGIGSDDIYYFTTLELMTQFVVGSIHSTLPNQSLAGESIVVNRSSASAKEYLTLDAEESFMIEVAAGESISVQMNSAQYDSDSYVMTFQADQIILDPYLNVGEYTAAVLDLELDSDIADSSGDEIITGTVEDETSLRDKLLALKEDLNEIESDQISNIHSENSDESTLPTLADMLPSRPMLDMNKLGELTSVLNTIYFVFDQAYIGQSAAPTLDQIAEMMKDNPAMMLEIDTHCDARGDTTYNDELSKQRAQAIATYLAWKGVAKDRLSLIWHGESQLANHCTDEVTCEETDHRINRRAEFKLLTETVAVITE